MWKVLFVVLLVLFCLVWFGVWGVVVLLLGLIEVIFSNCVGWLLVLKFFFELKIGSR